MPEEAAILAALGANEKSNRRRAVWRLNWNLARLTGDPRFTKYDWQLISLSSDHPLSWREYRRGALGFPWPVPQWAFTTLNIGERQMLIGAAIMAPLYGFVKATRFAVWHSLPEGQVAFNDLFEALVATNAYEPLDDKHAFRTYVLKQT